jgi:hypothetical protein
MECLLKLYGNVILPSGGIVFKNFPVDKMPLLITVNGKSIYDFDKDNIRVNQFPATIEITY